MLISFSLENWKSFRDEATFSLVASKERAFRAGLPHIAKHRLRLLPFAAVLGGNASGKTNLFQAFAFVRRFVLDGVRPDSLIPTQPFLLDPGMLTRPSRFSLTILPHDPEHPDWIYEYSFSVTRREVEQESLRRFSSSSGECMFSRRKGEIEFSERLRKAKDAELYKFAARGTRPNQLFLTNSVSQNIEAFKPVYTWLESSLILVSPDAIYAGMGLFSREKPLFERFERVLTSLDTGIIALDQEKIETPDSVRKIWDEEQLGDKEGVGFVSPLGDRLIASGRNGELEVTRLVARHRGSDGRDVSFRFTQESDGTRRLVDLVPAFALFSPETAAMPRVFVFDEIDRSLHTLLIRRLIEDYLDRCSPDSRWQMLVSTHDVMLMDQKLLRRDEMWLTERDENGCSTLLSIGDFMDLRCDVDVARHYLLGRMGGVPRLRSTGPAAKDGRPKA